ncbi:glycoside hydrolase family 25 protein [Fulvivirga sediminis]|uniref:Glycoside hydrolase family 25 protein n=1 Tax=Fulvivirga sediminis TaxID=2803949 RepID=A0A937FAK6_9BACT|nr:GH25 family lysozyme [Fulvivirga sediminis]MBL3658042.1 glycoside hydrolase family 25 protein [Fulvivirga sediminis]
MNKKHVVLILVIVAVMAAIFFYTGYLRFSYPSLEEYPIQGIDISHHQGNIDWEKLTKENMAFVFIKATEGGDYTDPKFVENWKNAQQQDIEVGAYHFYRLCRSGAEQASHFIATVPYNSNNLPPVVDLEFGGNCETDQSPEQLIREIDIFLASVEDHYHKKPIIYATQKFYDEYLQDQFSENPIWLRGIFGKPSLIDGRPWTFWQFANRGHLSGVETYVDINVFHGSENDFNELVKGN